MVNWRGILNRKGMGMNRFSLTLVVLLGLASMIVLIGCESSDDDASVAPSGLSVTPSAVTIPALGVTNVLFTASNGLGSYTWSIESAALGSIVSSGNSAIYTSTTNAGINYIHVVDSSNNTATASINHQ